MPPKALFQTVWCFYLLFSYVLSSPLAPKTIPPVVLVPGDGGSQIEAKLNKTEVVHYICEKKTTDFFDLWLNLELLVPLILDCWVDNMRLVYDNVTRTTSNSPGVETRVPGFGMTDSVEFLDPSKVSPSRSVHIELITFLNLHWNV